MKCNYPNCLKPAQWTPVVELPTLRTMGVHKPILSPLVHNPLSLLKGELRRNMVIYQYEQQLRDYKTNSNTITKTDKPTYLIGREVCQSHRETYNLFNWIRRSEWRMLREAARHHGLEIPEDNLIVVKFHPVGWRPGEGRLELTRDRMAKE